MPESGAAWVVGANGFLGSALVSTLRRGGHPVQEFTRARPVLDPSGEPAALPTAVRTIYWLASSVNPAIAEADPAKVRDDLRALDRMVQAAKRCDEARLVLVSSGGTVYDGAAAPPYTEDSPTAATGKYAAAKLAMERRLRDEPALVGRRTILRVSNAYGPGQPAASGQGVIAHWLRAIQRGKPLQMFGAPTTSRDYVFVADIAAALAAVHDAGPDLPDVLNIGSGVATSLQRVLDLVRDAAGQPEFPVEQLPARGFDVPRTWLDISAAGEHLMWKPETSLAHGIEAAWAALAGSGGRP